MKDKILNRKKEIIGIVVLLAIIVIGVSLFMPKKAADIAAVYNELKAQPEISSRIKAHTLIDKEEDDDIPTIKFQDEASEERDAMILMFDNDEKAEVFQYYFEEILKQEKAIRDKEEYGNFFKEINPMNGWISYVSTCCCRR